MKHFIFCSCVLLAACSQQQDQNTPQPQTAIPAPTVENAKATLDASKQIEQTTLNAAEQQRQTIEKTEGQ